MTTRATPVQEDAALDGDLGWTLGVVFRSFVKVSGAAVAEVPGGPRGFQVLRLAARSSAAACPETGQGAIAKRLGVDRTVMTYLVDDLVGAGLLERQLDPADRRQRRLVLTSKGRGAVQRLTDRLAQAEDHTLAALDPAEREVLRGMLARLADRAQRQDPHEGDACTLAEMVTD